MVPANYAASSDEALFAKLVSTAVKVGVHPDAIEMTRYAIKHPTHFAAVVEHAVARDYPFFALVGAAKAARKNLAGFTRAKCEFPITVIDQVFAKADSTIDDAKGKQDTKKVIGAAKEYAAEYAKAQTAQAKEELVAKLAESIPYFGDIPVICSFAFETNLKAERDLQNAVTEEVHKLRRAYFAFKDGNYVAGVQALTELGASADVACEVLDESVGGGIIGRTPVLGDLAKGTCKNFTGKVFDAATGLVKGGVGIIEDGVTAAKQFGNSIGCAVYSLIGNGCSSASPPDPNTLALNSAKAWCAPHGGLKSFLKDGQRIGLVCNDGSSCQQRPVGDLGLLSIMKCAAATAQERAANRAQKAAQLLEDGNNKLGPDLVAIFEEWSPRCPLADSQCKDEIIKALDEAGKEIKASLAGEKAYESNYFLHTSLPFGVARQKSQRAVREAEFRVLPQKWAQDFNASWMPRCGANQECVKHLTLTRNSTLTAVSQHHKQKPGDPHSATSVYYAEGETAARNFFSFVGAILIGVPGGVLINEPPIPTGERPGGRPAPQERRQPAPAPQGREQSTPDLRLRAALYANGAETGKVNTAAPYASPNRPLRLRKSDAVSCEGDVCGFNLGFYAQRNAAGAALSTYGLLTGASFGSVGNTVFFAAGETSKGVIHLVKLKAGENKVVVEIDPYKKTAEADEANNSFTVTIFVEP